MLKKIWRDINCISLIVISALTATTLFNEYKSNYIYLLVHACGVTSFIQLPIAHLCKQYLPMIGNCFVLLFNFVLQEALEVQNEDKRAINSSPTFPVSTVPNIKTDQTSEPFEHLLYGHLLEKYYFIELYITFGPF